MPPKIKLVFNDVAHDNAPAATPGLTLAIRTDARHATATLKKNLLAYMRAQPGEVDAGLEERVSRVVHDNYQIWGHKVLDGLAECIDYKRYGLYTPEEQTLNVHFYNAQALSQRALEKAIEMVRAQPTYKKGLPIVYVSLDDMIEGQGEEWGEIAFSRQFSLAGDQQLGYRARPGKKPLEEQIRDLAQTLEKLKLQHGEEIPFVLLEDNVRHAKMLNWVIDLMEENKVFDHGRLAGISTCFCCASDSERAAIQHRGVSVPVTTVVDYKEAKVDVVTPRDLLFDGFVVQVKDKMTRLPGVFMDLEKLFKIDAARTDEFRDHVRDANIEFCRALEDEFGIVVPVSWFSVSEAVSHVADVAQDTPMKQVLEKITRPNPLLPPSASPPPAP